jgi:DNA (cytosine-5)-methyltransferase 1
MQSLDLFSGIGGFALGFHWAGIETTAFCEIEDYPTKVLNKNWPGVPVHRDIRKLDGKEYKGIDIVTGGFPCQPHSLAGKRLASEDSRDLWGEMHRIICEAQPKWVVAENVPGLLSSESGRYFGRVLRDLAQAGYCVQWFCIPASAVGAWHKRERIWIVANKPDSNPNSLRSPEQKRKQEERPKINFTGCKGELDSTDIQNADSIRRDRRPKEQGDYDSEDGTRNAHQLEGSSGASRNVSNSNSIRSRQIQQSYRRAAKEQRALHKALQHSINEGIRKWQKGIWATELGVGRVVNGLSNRAHRIKGLGNAVVPQIPFLIGQAIKEVEQC